VSSREVFIFIQFISELLEIVLHRGPGIIPSAISVGLLTLDKLVVLLLPAFIEAERSTVCGTVLDHLRVLKFGLSSFLDMETTADLHTASIPVFADADSRKNILVVVSAAISLE